MAESPPSTARLRKIGRTLRRIREDAGLTLNAAGRRMERSGSSLSLIEKGAQGLRLRDLKHILDVYDVDPDTRHALMTLAAQQHRSGWWDDFKDTVSPAARDYTSLENSADSIDWAEAGFIPGILQTEDYARAVIRAGLPEGQLSKAERLVAYRMAGQQLLSRPQAPRLRFVIDEAALRRIRGGRQVMRVQLNEMIERSRSDNITVRVVPFDCEVDPGYIGPFQILDVGRPPLLSVVLTDHLTGRSIIEDDSDITAYRAKFAKISAAALNENDSRTLIQQISSDL